MVVDNRIPEGMKVWPKFKVGIKIPQGLSRVDIRNSLVFVPLLESNLAITGVYEYESDVSKSFYLDSEKRKTVSSHPIGLYRYQTYLDIKMQTSGKRAMSYFFKLDIHFDKLQPYKPQDLKTVGDR